MVLRFLFRLVLGFRMFVWGVGFWSWVRILVLVLGFGLVSGVGFAFWVLVLVVVETDAHGWPVFFFSFVFRRGA